MGNKKIDRIVDKLLLELPIEKTFFFNSYFSKYIEENNIDADPKGKNDNTLSKVIDFMVENQYLNFNTTEISKDSLKPKGIEAKKAGGHFKYVESLKKSKERENKQDKILDLELKLKTFESKIGKKLIVAGFIITFLSFLITVLTLEFWQTDENKNEQKIQVENPLLNKKESKLKDSLN